MRATFDLQSHSLHSDGELTPTEVVRAAAAAGVELLALTDHDSIAGVEEALRAGAEVGVEVVPATELSSVDEAYEELHILGYLIDHRDRELGATLEDLRADRERRVLAMADLLREAGFELDDSELRRRSAAGDPLGRPHLAHAILDHPANAQRLADEGIAGLRELFPRYLVPGVPTYVRARDRRWARRSSWSTVPGASRSGRTRSGTCRIRRRCERCSSASQASASMAWRRSTRLTRASRLICCARWRHELGLLSTGSSDFHGSSHKTFAGFRAFELYGHEPNLGPLTAAAPTGS